MWLVSKSETIVIADSCIGGLSVLKSLWKAGLASETVFLADYEINPLGVKDDSTIAGVVERWMHFASDKADTLIMACNTLSIRYHHLLAAAVDLPGPERVVSMVDCFAAMARAEKVVLEGKNVLVIGTRYTASQSLYQEILEELVGEVRVKTIAATELERQVARIQPWDGDSFTVLTSALRQAIGDTDVAVLACTCFPVVIRELQTVFPDVTFIDPGKYSVDCLKAGSDDREQRVRMHITGDVVSAVQVGNFARRYIGIGEVCT